MNHLFSLASKIVSSYIIVDLVCQFLPFRCLKVDKSVFFEEFILVKAFLYLPLKMSNRSQNRKAVEELVSAEPEIPIVKNNQKEYLVAGTSKSPMVHPEKLEEIKTFLRKAIMSDLSKLLADFQIEML